MTQNQIAELTMLQSVKNFLDENTGIHSSDAAFQTLVADYNSKLTALLTIGADLMSDNSTFSNTKEEIRNTLITKLVELNGFAKVGLKKAGVKIEANQMQVKRYFFNTLADAELLLAGNNSLTVMQEQTAVLSPLYVTATDLTDLSTLLSDFLAAKNDAENVHHTTPNDRKAFTAQLNELIDLVKDMRLLSKKFKAVHAQFVEDFKSNSTVHELGIHHTNLNVTVTDKVDGKAVAEAITSISGSNKSANTDASGNAIITSIKNGKCTLTVTATGYVQVVKEVKIERGRDNKFIVQLEKAA